MIAALLFSSSLVASPVPTVAAEQIIPARRVDVTQPFRARYAAFLRERPRRPGEPMFRTHCRIAEANITMVRDIRTAQSSGLVLVGGTPHQLTPEDRATMERQVAAAEADAEVHRLKCEARAY